MLNVKTATAITVVYAKRATSQYRSVTSRTSSLTVTFHAREFSVKSALSGVMGALTKMSAFLKIRACKVANAPIRLGRSSVSVYKAIVMIPECV